jgi:cytochrome bd ubiquinol oxidase subunit II
MHLYDVPMVFVLVGLVLYVVLGGADFGAAVWQLHREDRVRDFAHDSMAPVWEANHVWLIFVLTVMWTSYPTAFGSIASTLSAALLLAGFGIIVRGAAYALRAGVETPRQARRIDAMSAVSSVLAPFFLGAAVGGIASGRVPVGNAAGNLFTSWFNPTGIVIGLIAVASSAYLAAVFLAADAVRTANDDLVPHFRTRALAAGAVAGVLAVVGLVVLHGDAPRLYHGLVSGDGLPALIVSVVAGLATLALVLRERFDAARVTSALAVAAVIAGWTLAQRPLILPGLTIRAAAAPHDTLVAVIVAVLAGGAILFPSLGLLFRLVLGGRLGYGGGVAAEAPRQAAAAALAHGLLARVAAALLVAGFGLLTVAEAGVAHAFGVVALLAFVVVGFVAAVPLE